MSECPIHKLRPDLPPMIDRIAKLPVDSRGYPVPFFVQWLYPSNTPAEPNAPGSYPEFRVADINKWNRCVKEKLCWVCGEKMGVHLAFLIGPMCAINRTSAEPPSHLDCAEWSAKGCPFLTKPQMVRREDDKFVETFGDKTAIGGEMIKRNPGAMCIWVTKSYKLFRDGKGGLLVEIGDMESITWWSQGRAATRDEVLESIASGLPLLLKMAQSQEDIDEITRRLSYVATELVPKE